jgi:hypothetical protein
MADASATAPILALPATRFRGVDRRVALAVLAALAAIVVALLPIALNYTAPPSRHPGDGDLALYKRIVQALHDGGEYYQTVHTQLRDGGYATRPAFAWRTPTYQTLLAWLPSTGAAKLLLCALALAATAGGYLLIRRRSYGLALLSLPFLLASMGMAATDVGVYFSEYLTGMLILSSVVAFGLGWRRGGIALGVAALFVRELAALYVLVCLLLSWREGRRGEVAAWLAAIAAYGAFFLWHVAMVNAQLGPTDFAWPEGWISFGGARFVLSTAWYNGLFVLAPVWLAALLLPMGLLGLLAWPADGRMALTVFAYVTAFAVVGKPLNTYWGELYTPILTLALVWALPALADLARAAFTPSPKARTAPAVR